MPDSSELIGASIVIFTDLIRAHTNHERHLDQPPIEGPAMTNATATVQPPAVGTYRIDPSTSTITFTTRHMFGA